MTVRCFNAPYAHDSYPGDENLGDSVHDALTGFAPNDGQSRSQSTFKEGREDLKIYAGLAVSAKDVERVPEGIGQQTEAWLCQEREVILKQNEALRPDKDHSHFLYLV